MPTSPDSQPPASMVHGQDYLSHSQPPVSSSTVHGDEFRRAAAEKTLAARAEFDMLQQRCAEVKSALDERDAVNARARQRLDDALTAGQRGTGGEGDAK